MPKKLKDYQVLDVLCSGTFYKVRHKVTNNFFAWKAYNCSSFSGERIQNIINEVKIVTKIQSTSLLRYHDTILHAPSKTLYFVLEYNNWQSIQELISVCEATDRCIAESFTWYVLHELARVCKAVEHLHFVELRQCITPSSIFVDQSGSGELRINCFDLIPLSSEQTNIMRQVGDVMRTLCFGFGDSVDNIKAYHYSDDLKDVVNLLTNDKNVHLRPDVILYHPTVLANLETLPGPKKLNDIFVPVQYSLSTSDANKCDSEKAVDLCKTVEPAPRTVFNIEHSPVYTNISPNKSYSNVIEECISNHDSLSPTVAALALELPGFIPRSRRPVHQALESYTGPQQVSQDTFSHHWMSRLVALRQREESLNKRERDLIAKEIVESPSTKIIALDNSSETYCNNKSNGITLPPLIQAVPEDRDKWVSRRRQRNSLVRSKMRRKSYAYEDLDSSLSADNGDGSMIVTTTKFTKENMPRRNIFPDMSAKKVHFTSANPFTDSDESVTLTFYELENLDRDGYQMPRHDQKTKQDITKFKYLDVEKVTLEKRAAMHQWNNSSPSKQAKVYSDITNSDSVPISRTPSKSSLTSKGSTSSKISTVSITRSGTQCEVESAKVSEWMPRSTRASTRQSIAHTPIVPPEIKKSKSRKSLLPFKTPFKFMTATKI